MRLHGEDHDGVHAHPAATPGRTSRLERPGMVRSSRRTSGRWGAHVTDGAVRVTALRDVPPPGPRIQQLMPVRMIRAIVAQRDPKLAHQGWMVACSTRPAIRSAPRGHCGNCAPGGRARGRLRPVDEGRLRRLLDVGRSLIAELDPRLCSTAPRSRAGAHRRPLCRHRRARRPARAARAVPHARDRRGDAQGDR